METRSSALPFKTTILYALTQGRHWKGDFHEAFGLFKAKCFVAKSSYMFKGLVK